MANLIMCTYLCKDNLLSCPVRLCRSGTIGLGTNFRRRYARFAYETGRLTFFLDTAQQILTSMHYQYGLIHQDSPLSAGGPLILSHCQYTASEQILIVILNKRIQIECRDATHNPRDLPSFCAPSVKF